MSVLVEGYSHKSIYSFFILLYLLAILYFRTFLMGQLIGGFVGIYLLPSIMWVLLALIIKYLLPPVRYKIKQYQRKKFCWVAFVSAVGLIVALYFVGLLTGLGASPYDHSPKGIMINIFHLGAMLLGIELSRAWLLNHTFKKRSSLGIVFTSLLFTVFTININSLLSLDNSRVGAEYAGRFFVPALAENIVASCLSLLCGAVPALIYRGTLLAYHWLLPVLPNLSWVAWALIGTFIPAFSIVIIYQIYHYEVLRLRLREKESPAGWVATSVVSVLMIWFAVGVFNVFPNVIISGSMMPKIDIGDVVIIQKVEPEEIMVGDVIQFRGIEEDIRINHRVINIHEDERGLPMFVTKGDANRSPDNEPVIAEQLMGKVVHVVPKLGWITIMLRSPG